MTAGGDYRIDTVLRGPGGTSDSFWVQLDGGPTWLFDTDFSGNWVTDPVSDRGGANPVIVTLAPGDHTLVFKVREDGTQLDTITLTALS